MGFNQYNFGNIRDCWIEDGFIYQEAPYTKHVFRYPTRLPVSIPRQCNVFVSDTVAFLLYYDQKMYIGRFDGWISIYRMSDNMLVGVNGWTPPGKPETDLIGFFKAPNGTVEVRRDRLDPLTIYAMYEGVEGLLPKSIPSAHCNIPKETTFRYLRKDYDWFVIDEGGARVEIELWNLQDERRRRDCRVFL